MPAGVPDVVWVDDELLPPHPTENTKASTTIGAVRTGKRLRFRAHNHADPRNSNIHANAIGPVGKLKRGILREVAGAVVPTFTVTVCVPVPLICTELLESVQVGAGVTTGVIAQLRFTVPVNDPIDAKARLKLAVCPAGTVCEVGEPDAEAIEKSGAAV